MHNISRSQTHADSSKTKLTLILRHLVSHQSLSDSDDKSSPHAFTMHTEPVNA